MDALMDNDITKNYLNEKVLGLCVVFFGLLYIPAFTHGYFWLWVFPFIANVTFFARTMINSSIEQISKVGDEAKQAKAMIPEFIKINVMMTVFLSIPFLLTLWLNQLGYIQRLQYSDMDRSFFEYFLGIFAKDYMLPNMYLGIENHASVQIMVSNLFFIVMASLALLFACFKNIKQLFLILFHKKSYKFLQKDSNWGDVSVIRHYCNIGLIITIFVVSGFLFNAQINIMYLGFYLIFLNSFIFLQISNIISAIVQIQVQSKTSKNKE